ncbi:MAG: DUF433 domain-containing protein [Bryobacteraceae bacterium]
MNRSYVEQREGGYYVAGTRVALGSLVYVFRGGESPETIQQNFPSLKLGTGLRRYCVLFGTPS